jgi:hypothetical protein
MLKFTEVPFDLDDWEADTQRQVDRLISLGDGDWIKSNMLEGFMDFLTDGYHDPEPNLAKRAQHWATNTMNVYLTREILDLATYHYIECNPWNTQG